MGCRFFANDYHYLRFTIKIVEVEYEADSRNNALLRSELKGRKAVS